MNKVLKLNVKDRTVTDFEGTTLTSGESSSRYLSHRETLALRNGRQCGFHTASGLERHGETIHPNHHHYGTR